MKQNVKNQNIQSKELESFLKEVSLQMKSNPNNFIIIKKWNRRIFKKYKFKIFHAIEKQMDLQLNKNINKIFMQ